MNNRIVRFLFRHPLIVGALILVFPIIVGFLYTLPIPQFVAVPSEDLIAYYGIAFGLVGAMITYLDDRARREVAKKRNAVPDVSLKLRKAEEKLSATIYNVGEKKVTDIFLYDEKLGVSLSPCESRTILFELDPLSHDHDTISVHGYDDFDENDFGFPNYVQLCLSDDLGRGWSLVYERTGNESAPEYPLTSAELMSW